MQSKPKLVPAPPKPRKRTLKNIYAITRESNHRMPTVSTVPVTQNVVADSINEAIEYIQFDFEWCTVVKAEIVMRGVRA